MTEQHSAGQGADKFSRQAVVTDRAAAEGYIARICFKTGPPSRTGVELEWTVHHREDSSRPLDILALAKALGDHAPPTLRADSPQLPLGHGGSVTVEPGGQVEISTPPYESIDDLVSAISADIAQLDRLLAEAGLVRGDAGCDPYRQPSRLLHTPRYAAMERAFDHIGPHGRAMMCGTAGLQICLDIGTTQRAAARWQALHDLGPVLIAIFANSARQAGTSTGWASSRMHTWYGTDPVRTMPPQTGADPVRQWARRVLDTPLLCRRQPGDCWDAPAITFADWIDGAFDPSPSYDDLDYHLSTMFPPVRPRGYLEVRYLDTQPGDDWLLPVATLTALFAREETVDAAMDIARPVTGQWLAAARHGLADPRLYQAARALAALTARALTDTDLSAERVSAVREGLAARIDAAGSNTGGNH